MMLPMILTRSFLSSIYNLLKLYIQNFVAHVPRFSSQKSFYFLLFLFFLECLPSKVNT